MIKKEHLKIVKLMFKNSLENGLVNPQKAQIVLSKVVSAKPASLAKILKIYKRLIVRALAKETATIQIASRIPDQNRLVANLKRLTGARKVVFKVNPKIIFGAKIVHDDWIYDATLETKLKQLTLDS